VSGVEYYSLIGYDEIAGDGTLTYAVAVMKCCIASSCRESDVAKLNRWAGIPEVVIHQIGCPFVGEYYCVYKQDYRAWWLETTIPMNASESEMQWPIRRHLRLTLGSGTCKKKQ